MKRWLFVTGMVMSTLLVVIFVPIRWRSDLLSSRVALGSREEYDTPEKITIGGYVLVEKKVDPKKLSEEIDGRKAYLGAVEFTDGYNDALKAEILRKEKRLFFRAFDPNPKGVYSPNEIYAIMRRAIRERSVDLIITDSVPKDIERKFRERFKIVERPFPHPEVPLHGWIFLIPILLILASLSPALALIGLVIAFFSFDIAVSFSSILSTLAVYKWRRNSLTLFLSFLVLGILTSASLSNFMYLNGVLNFKGVKLSLVLLPSVVLIKGLVENDWILKSKTTLLGVILVLGAVGAIYIIRSGNQGFVFPYERQIRDFLDSVFWVRPRFKELFGYVFLFIWFNSRSRWRFVFEFFGSIALVTTFNTFCHIKAPIYTSIYRSFLAFFIAYGIYLLLGGVKLAENRAGSDKPSDGRS
jgi:hypothetical protein